jgi:WS/DGAT/MGAT family acyltransferase
MAPTDALFWFAETALPEFRPIIAGLYVLDRTPDVGAARASIDSALSLVPRLRQRVVAAPADIGLPEWRDDPHFDAAYHVRHLSLPVPGGQRELLDLAAALLATPLDRQRPLWEVYWIDGLEGGRSACFLKLHHSVVDGVGSIAILDAMTAPVGSRARRPRRPSRRAPPAPAGLLERTAALVGDQAEWAARLAWRMARAPLGAVRHPRRSADAAWRTARGLRGMVGDLLEPALHDPLAVPGSGLSRRLDLAELSLDRLRKIKAPLDVTLNDLVLASLAGALGAAGPDRSCMARWPRASSADTPRPPPTPATPAVPPASPWATRKN